MTQQEIKQITDNIIAIKDILFKEDTLKQVSLNWEEKKNVVIRSLRFSSDLDLIITYIYYLDTMGVYLRHIEGYDDLSYKQLVKTKGTTDSLTLIAKYFAKAIELKKKYNREYKKFEKEYNKILNRKR